MKEIFHCEIVEHIAVLGRSGTTTKELNLVAFAGAEPKFDVRSWYREAGKSPKPLKGTQLTTEEIAALKTALNAREDIPDLSKRPRNPFGIFKGMGG